jgi:hypothetical protein
MVSFGFLLEKIMAQKISCGECANSFSTTDSRMAELGFMNCKQLESFQYVGDKFVHPDCRNQESRQSVDHHSMQLYLRG